MYEREQLKRRAMSHIPGGMIPHRYLNAIRPNRVVPDPFFASVLLLLPLSDSGSTVTDYSSFANPVTTVGTPTVNSIFDQNNGNTLFTENTLQAQKNLGGIERVTAYTVNNASQIGANDDLVFEGWFYYTNCNTVSSALARFTQGVGNNRWGIEPTALTPNNITWRTSVATATNQAGITWNAWHYFAMQTVDASNLTYCSIDGVLLQTLFTSNPGSVQWQCFVGGNVDTAPPGPTADTYNVRYAQIRATKANRYGSTAAPVPSRPWPTFGP